MNAPHAPIATFSSVFDLDAETLAAGPGFLAEMGQPSYRAEQIMRWVYERGAESFDQMTDLPASLRTVLARRLTVYRSSIERHDRASDGTAKLLLKWPDGTTSECVLIPDGDRQTACISTQVGCPVGCVFCASGIGGLDRNLVAGQIVEQAMRVAALCRPNRLTNVVFMGLGEPLHNYDATVAALRKINSAEGMNIGARKITVSTVGLPKQMKRLADEKLQITLALSLHAPTDELRARLIPWAASITIDSLVEAANYYFDRTGREITLEYVLLAGVNDLPEQARQLATVARRMRSNINLIRYNPVDGLPYERPSAEASTRFQQILRDRGLNVHLRRSRGRDIDGACGQLRRRALASTPPPPP
ncbi:MAG: 23S rRNA (adenine(2503)-C(2))-methyltransferase RlmN [Phycisphaerales bacterium]|nr:23S rRNA (adenine(2503)-C(2))-methyltransferase RlmN [Phycisphaerales bacterium]